MSKKQVVSSSFRSKSGHVLAVGHESMEQLFVPKVLIVRQILGLSAQHIASFFGVVGAQYVEALRSEMISELERGDPACGWRDIANRVKGREESEGLTV